MEDQDFQSPDILVSLSWSDLWCWSYCQLSNLPILFASDSLICVLSGSSVCVD